MNVRVRSVVGSALFVFGLAAAAGCGGSSPTAPSASATAAASTASANHASPPSSVRPDGGPVVTTSLHGSFDIHNGSGDGVSGTYSGTGVSSGGSEQAFLSMQITGGTGIYAGATGSVDALGSGAFSGEGTYSLSARGDALLDGGKHAQITFNLSGTSAASCIPIDQFTVTQTGSGTMGRAGRVTARFQHTVTSGAGCFSD